MVVKNVKKMGSVQTLMYVMEWPSQSALLDLNKALYIHDCIIVAFILLYSSDTVSDKDLQPCAINDNLLNIEKISMQNIEIIWAIAQNNFFC